MHELRLLLTCDSDSAEFEWRCSDNDNYVRPRDLDFECSRSFAIIEKAYTAPL